MKGLRRKNGMNFFLAKFNIKNKGSDSSVPNETVVDER